MASVVVVVHTVQVVVVLFFVRCAMITLSLVLDCCRARLSAAAYLPAAWPSALLVYKIQKRLCCVTRKFADRRSSGVHRFVRLGYALVHLPAPASSSSSVLECSPTLYPGHGSGVPLQEDPGVVRAYTRVWPRIPYQQDLKFCAHEHTRVSYGNACPSVPSHTLRKFSSPPQIAPRSPVRSECPPGVGHGMQAYLPRRTQGTGGGGSRGRGHWTEPFTI